MYDSLLRDIERAQAELSSINTALANTGLYQVLLKILVSLKEEIKQLLNLQASSEVAASILKNEVDELKQTKVEGLSEDPEMRLDFGSISSRGIKNDR